MLYMITFTINIPQMLAYIYIPYMDPMGTIPWSYFTPVSDIKKNLRMNAPLTFQCPEKHPRKKGKKIVSRECVYFCLAMGYRPK